MKPCNPLCLVCLILAGVSAWADYAPREWTANEVSIEASLLELNGATAKLQPADTNKPAFQVEVRRLSEADKAYLINVKKAKHFASYMDHEDPALVEKAFAALSELGEAGVEERNRSFARMYKSLSQEIKQATSSTGAKVELSEELCQELLALQKEATERITVLTKDKVPQAHETYNKLKALWKRVEQGISGVAPMVTKLEELNRLESLMISQGGVPERAVDSIASAKAFLAKNIAGRGASSEVVAQFASQAEAPSSPLLNLQWQYARARKIETLNKSATHGMTADELANAKLLNDYREAIGRVPLYFEPRLTVAARKHSAEMESMNYFSHTSPVKGREGFGTRIKLEKYPLGAGGENIASGGQTAEANFTMWFNSPGHHQNMTSPAYRDIGVGQSGKLWTQNFGRQVGQP